MRVTATLAVVATGALATRVAAEPTFFILPNMKSGAPPGDATFVTDISADGSVVVGFTVSDATGEPWDEKFEAFRWQEGVGIFGLGDLPGGDFLSDAFTVSAMATS